MSLNMEMTSEEQFRIEKLFEYEKPYWQAGRRVAGLDEAGRGPLAGPVVAAAVIFEENPFIPFVNDSKQVSEEMRDYLFERIQTEALAFAVGIASVAEIDTLNILQASFLAMQRAINALKARPDHLLVDGRSFAHNEIPFTTLVKGDSLSYSVAAASILAKVTRDRIMSDYDKDFPGYGFSKHKGYATTEHLDAIEEYGFCEIHRKSFHPRRFWDFQLELFEND